MILYSIIIPVYNVEKYLEECLESVLHQSYANWETILIDDGSTDNLSSFLCDKYAKKDSRFQVYHRKNEGSLMARRYGIKKAKGDYFLFVDSDDYLHNDLLLTINSLITKHHSDLVMFRFQRVGGIHHSNSPIVFKDGTIIGENGLSKELMWKKIISGCDLNNLALKVVKRENIDINADYTPYAFFKSGTDLLQCLPILVNSKKILFTEKILYYYRFNPNGISSSKAKRIDIRNIEMQLKTRSVLQERKLHYLQQAGYASSDNLKIFYQYCFDGYIELLISWLANEPNKEKRKWITERVLKEEILLDAKKCINPSDFSGRFKTLYYLFWHKNPQIKIPLMLLTVRNNFLSLIRIFLYKIRRLQKFHKKEQ